LRFDDSLVVAREAGQAKVTPAIARSSELRSGRWIFESPCPWCYVAYERETRAAYLSEANVFQELPRDLAQVSERHGSIGLNDETREVDALVVLVCKEAGLGVPAAMARHRAWTFEAAAGVHEATM
jgi:hypothetical protein